MSLLVRYWVPNMQRKRDLKDQIRRIQSKIYGLSCENDSTLRALVLVQLNLLDALRKSRATFLPDYATVAAVGAQAAAILERRVEMIEEIDSTYEQTAVKWECTPRHRDELGWVASHFFPDTKVGWWHQLKVYIKINVQSWRGKAGATDLPSGAWKRYSVKVEFKDRSGKQVPSTLEPLQVQVQRDPGDDRRIQSVGEVVGLAVSIVFRFSH